MFKTSKSLITFTLISIVLIIALRLAWFNYHSNDELFVHIQGGLADLRSMDLEEKYVSLAGEWVFYPDEIVHPNELNRNSSTIVIPDNWNESIFRNQNYSTHGTYQLQIELPINRENPLTLRFLNIFSAASFFVNGELIGTFNELGHQKHDRGLMRGPFRIDLPNDVHSINLIVQVSNQQIPFIGGIIGDVHLGDQRVIEQHSSTSYAMQLLVSFIFFLHAIYSLIIFFTLKDIRKNTFLYFSLMLTLFGAGILIDDDVILQLPLSIGAANKLILCIFISTLFIMFMLISKIFQMTFKKWNNPYILFPILIVSTMFIPIEYVHFWTMFQFIVFLYTVIFMLYLAVKAILHRNHFGYFIFLFVVSYFSNAFWGALIKSNTIEMPFYPLDYIFSMVFIMIIFFKQHGEIVEENKKQTDIIIANEKKKDHFLAMTAHELRNPLHAMMVSLENVLSFQNESLSKKAKNELQLALEVSHHLKYTLNDLQDLSRLHDHQIVLDIKPTYLYGLTNHILEILRLYSRSEKVEIKNQVPKHFPPIEADEQRLFQVLFNLIQNSIKFTKAGFIYIQANVYKGKAIITIEDTGIGIREDELQTIIQPYERGSNLSYYHDVGGVGLGLSIAKQFIELHDGQFSIESEVGSGTKVTIHLDLSTKTTEVTSTITHSTFMQHQEPYRPSTSNRHKDRIIVLDDHPLNLQTIRMALADQYDVVTYDNPEQVLELQDLYTYSLIITDIMMPQMSGHTFTQKIREQFSLTDLPILLLTALNHPSEIATGLKNGANDYVCKPIERNELLARVQTLVELQRAVKDQIAKESAWLQAQIKPHFIYNTLNSIASLGTTNHEAMVDLLQEFGSYLNRSFDSENTKQLVPLKDEIQLVKSYVRIQVTRFPQSFKVEWAIQEDIEALIPPLVLQTLVENALHHGVLKNRAQKGVITIQLIEHQQQPQLAITDNGPGIDIDKVNRLIHSQNPDSVGIYNAHYRLKRINHTGLLFSNIQPHGTCVTFKLPKADNHENRSN
ncbi:ATP-binding protein [Alkalihalobacillus pseudalcaliphilus]|uniref:hybrid sensor histidine kinase/response regulator n=1 Tax=Alkalihalobacillus pseudalcaliphilus TaxID=79884 RepID=UPI00064DCCC0|nr:ATP-binding protein [Alkalihalobacillus pseudalcaliphilus]KMK78002.1 hypothetical protein AB990_00680 [Alkalihalobacillus pseudalcaliphilus]